MSKHRAMIVEGSIRHTDAHGVAFTMRCCGNQHAEASGHIQDAAFLSDEELTAKVSRALRDHAELHGKATRAKVRAMRLAKQGHFAEVEMDDGTQGDETTGETVHNQVQDPDKGANDASRQ